jgi:hypothetical protein
MVPEIPQHFRRDLFHGPENLRPKFIPDLLLAPACSQAAPGLFVCHLCADSSKLSLNIEYFSID